MAVWLYKEVIINASNYTVNEPRFGSPSIPFKDYLDQVGKEGWELVQIVPFTKKDEGDFKWSQYKTVYFKKKSWF